MEKLTLQVQGCEVYVYRDPAAACRAVADEILRLVSSRDSVVLNMAGGSTVLGVWRALAEEDGLDLTRACIFWGDDHVTEPQAKDNNFALAWPYVQELLERGALLPQRVHRIPVWNPRARRPLTVEEAQAAAKAFAAEIETAGGRFDLTILGLSADAHTASLLPGVDHTVLKSERLVEALAYGDDLRITLTPKAFELSDRVIMLVTGAKKSGALFQILTEELDLQRRPGQLIRLLNALVVADREAAAPLLEDLT